jgi:hypothetical protein
MAGITFAVYDPPKPGLPYLAVAIFTTNGEVSAVAYKTAAEAEMHNSKHATGIAKGPD